MPRSFGRIALPLVVILGVLNGCSSGTGGADAEEALVAQDQASCAGLTEYRRRIDEVKAQIDQALSVLEAGDIFLVTEEQWRVAAQDIERIRGTWDTITPPPYAVEYHATMAESFRVAEGFFQALAEGSSPLMEIMARQGAEDTLNAREANAVATATAQCPEFLALAQVLGYDATPTATTPTATSAVNASPTVEVGDPLLYPNGTFAASWLVENVRVETFDVMPYSPEPARAVGKFVAVRFEATNLGKMPGAFPAIHLVLRDSEGRTFTRHDEESQYTVGRGIYEAQPEWGEWQPGLAYPEAVVYDVPKDAHGFTLASEDGTFSLELNT